MNKKLIFGLALLCIAATGCAKSTSSKTSSKIIADDGSIVISKVDEDGKAVRYNKKIDGFTDVTEIDLKLTSRNNPVSISLADYENKDVLINLSCDIMVLDSTGTDNKVTWMINEPNANFPQLFDEKLASGKWKTINSKVFVSLGSKRQVILSGAGLNKDTSKVYLKNFKLTISGDDLNTKPEEIVTWLEAPSIKETYKGIFDYFGLAVTYNEEYSKEDVRKGLKYQADYITMGNEFKPDFIFRWVQPKKFKDFKGEDGKNYKVPDEKLAGFDTVDKILQYSKENGLKMRGHVLVWHSQTPEWFFYENWGANGNKNYVSVNEMNARQEWYIKTVLEHIADWEKKNNNGEHIVYTWDVVNEAASDSATETAWVRPASGSKWTTIYGDETYIVNAFRYANKYAPADVKLAYNDYCCYIPAKTKAICKIIDAIQAAPDARIDVLGMQTHIQVDFPALTGNDSFETAVQTFVAKGLNVQVTELDIANGKKGYSSALMKDRYKDFMKVCIANRKTETKKGIEGVTIWGLNDEGTWLNALQDYKGHKQYPLLFKTTKFVCKPAFYGFIEAAESK